MDFAFTNAGVVTMDRAEVLPGHTVAIEDGVIIAVAPDGAVEALVAGY